MLYWRALLNSYQRRDTTSLLLSIFFIKIRIESSFPETFCTSNKRDWNVYVPLLEFVTLVLVSQRDTKIYYELRSGPGPWNWGYWGCRLQVFWFKSFIATTWNIYRRVKDHNYSLQKFICFFCVRFFCFYWYWEDVKKIDFFSLP